MNNANIDSSLIDIQDCCIQNRGTATVSSLTWQMQPGQFWLVIGPNGGGKADFVKALEGILHFEPNTATSSYKNIFTDSVEVVSLERAARLIQEEREQDESEYIEGGVDIGRTGRFFIAQSLSENLKKGAPLPEIAKRLETFPEIKLCGVEKILDRGLKYMSTGEIRRTLLARALVSRKKLLVLSDPFAGLDAESRSILLDFFTTIASRQLNTVGSDNSFPRIILSMERYSEIPKSVTHVLEFSQKSVSFCGGRTEYEGLLQSRAAEQDAGRAERYKAFAESVCTLSEEMNAIMGVEHFQPKDDVLVAMNNVNVGWSGHQVLKNLSWTLRKGEHWLIRGPNGSGKTTFLELITGDNMQVFSNDIQIFGARRGSGETVWDIKHRLGIVSYRLHVEYRMLGGTSLRDVIMSGFHDSIGLYQAPSDVEMMAAEKWLTLGGFEGRGKESFGNISYGEQRAILILRAAVKCPPIMILDEPCHGLDEQFRQKILDLLEIIASLGTTTFLHVTHEPSEVLECERHILELCPQNDPMYKIITK